MEINIEYFLLVILYTFYKEDEEDEGNKKMHSIPFLKRVRLYKPIKYKASDFVGISGQMKYRSFDLAK